MSSSRCTAVASETAKEVDAWRDWLFGAQAASELDAAKAQLDARQAKYNVSWRPEDYDAPWVVHSCSPLPAGPAVLSPRLVQASQPW